MTWHSLVESCVFVAANQGCVQIAIYLVRFACGQIALHALRAVQRQLESVVVAWVVLEKQVIGIFYSVLVATMVGQRIWQRHYHILAKRMNMLWKMSMASARIGVRRLSLRSMSNS
uniref:Uncharacterized protein n=1 Tax=Oryza barthii TaxID=65489 RepID=A0A0D3HNT4_9ORYZ